MTYDELTATLPQDLANAFTVSPGYIGADSLDLETFIETVWKVPVTVDNYKAVAQQFQAWYKERSPDEYHDPPAEFPGVGGGWGGARPGNPNGKRGGARPGSGPTVRRIQLGKESAQKLRILTMNRRSIVGGAFSENDMVESLISVAYAEYDAMIQQTAEEAAS